MNKTKRVFSIITIIIVVGFGFHNSLNNGFVNWDDDYLVINNDDIKSLEFGNLKTMFTSYYVGHYHPLTMISLAFDYKIGGLSAKVYHTHSLLLHIFNSILLFFIFCFFFKRHDISIILVLLFALHPFKVESVAWISERKDLLFSFYYLLSILSYLYYLKNNKKFIFILLSFCFFILSLLSKTSAVTLPPLLLLFDYYTGRDIKWKLLTEKLLFFIASIFFGVLTIYVLKNVNAIYDISDTYSVFERVLMPFYALIFYLFKFIVPVNLSASYFFAEKVNNHLPLIYYFSPVVVFAIAFMIYKIKILKKEIIFGTLFFLVTIFLFLQILPSGRVIAADRYTYIPYIGLLFIVGHLLLYYENKVFRYAVLLLICVFMLITNNRIEVWSNGERLFSDIIEKNPENEVGYVNRGIAKYYGFTQNNMQDFFSAISDFNKALEIDSMNEKAIFNRGNCYYNINKISEALTDFNQVLRINPQHERALNNRGLIYSLMKQDKKALNDYNAALRINPQYADAYLNRGIVYFNTGQLQQACNDWIKARILKNNRANDLLLSYCN